MSFIAKGQTDKLNFSRNWEVEGNKKDQLALVIGNSLYRHNGELVEPANDAQIIGAALREQGAEVMMAYNLDLEHMEKTFREFSKKFRNFKTGIIYYAGHGFQVRGRNYIVPVDANPKTINEVAGDCIDVDYVLSRINDGDKAKMIILDACRDNPFSRNWVVGERSASVGLAAMSPSRNSLIMFSTAKGTRVLDDNPFAEALAEEIRNGSCSNQLVSNVFLKVEAENPNQQIYQEGLLLDPICFGKENRASNRLVQKPKIVLDKALDADQDGVPDTDDHCPDSKGYASLNGCNLKPLAGWRRKMSAFGLSKADYEQEISRLLGTGLPAAQARAGYLYQYGNGKKIEDRVRGIELIKSSANAGDPFGQYLLGMAYLKGDGEPISYRSANWWFEKAALQSFPEAQYELAKSLEKGRGTAVDLEMAFSWMVKSSDAGYVPAESDLGNYYYSGTGTKPDYTLAIKFYQRAADKGMSVAQINLGNCYLTGKGGSADLKQATYWYERAFEKGDPGGLYDLGISYLNGDFAPLSDQTGISFLKRAAGAGHAGAQKILLDKNVRW